MGKRIKSGWWLLGILGLAFLVRIVLIDWVPARLTVDEMSLGYNAYSILKTGKDEWGRSWPLVFQAFGDFKLPLYIYLTVPFVWLLGLTVLSTKMVSISAGTALVYMVYLIGRKINGSERVGLISAGLAALTPWAIQLSRQALESHLALLWFSIGIYLLLLNRQVKNSKWLIRAAVCLGGTFYAYIAYRLLIVLLVPIIWWWLEKTDKRKVFFVALLITVLPLLPGLFSVSGLARAKQTSLLTDPGITAAVDENRSFCYLVDRRFSPGCKVIFNKVTQTGSRLVGNYLSFFSPEFLFLSGDKNLYLNHPDFGEFHFLLLPVLLLGLMGLTAMDTKNRKLIVGLLFLAPLPAALSGTAQMVRASAMLLPLLIIMGMGAEKLWGRLVGLKGAGWRVMAILTGMFMAGQWLTSYFLVYPTKFDNAAYQMPTAVVADLKQIEPNRLVYINDKFSDAHIWLAFYLQLDPGWYQASVVRPEPDGFGFSHPTQLGPYRFGSETFNDLFCRQKLTNFGYISADPAMVTLTDKTKVGYQTHEYRNFSGVHVQARLIDSDEFENFLKFNQLGKEEFCAH